MPGNMAEYNYEIAYIHYAVLSSDLDIDYLESASSRSIRSIGEGAGIGSPSHLHQRMYPARQSTGLGKTGAD